MAKSNTERRSSKKVWALRVAVALVLIAALLLSLVWRDEINRKLGLVKTEESAYAGNSTEEVLAPGAEAEGAGGDLNVHFVDVGQGDACIIELPDDKTMLIDAGDTKSANKTRLLSYIDDNIKTDKGSTIEWFDYVILTHPDSDHCGGMYDVLTKYPAKEFYRPNVYSTYTKGGFTDPATEIFESEGYSEKYNNKDTAAYGKAIQAAYEGKPEGKSTVVHISDATNDEISKIEADCDASDPNYYSFTFYAPLAASYKDWNDYSPIMILDYHGKRFMLSGDAEAEAEASFVAKATAPSEDREEKYKIFDDDFTVDVFKLGHHGSRTSSSEAFIEVMTTAENRPNVIAIVSCGEGNSYGHPHSETLEKLGKMGFSEENIVRTDVNGTIAMSVRAATDESGALITENGRVVYELRMGAETVRRTVAAVPVLTWTKIVIVAIIIILVIFIILPLVSEHKKAARAVAKAVGVSNGGSKSGTQGKSGTRGKNSGGRK